jgi:putative hemolysin
MVSRGYLFAIPVALVLLTGCDDGSDTPVSQPRALTEDERGSVGPGNPAAYYCQNSGHKPEGSDCVFADGTRCEQWSFWRAECGKEHSYCQGHGGTVVSEARDSGGFKIVTAMCTVNGKTCEEDGFSRTGVCD